MPRAFSRKFLDRKERVQAILPILKKTYPEAKCSLDHRTPLELLVATILSAQSTDQRVNIVTKDLFKKYKSAADYAKVPQEELEQDIHSTGFYRNKAKSIRAMAQALIDQHNGEVPNTMEELFSLPGVGRKTANVVLGNAFGINVGITVDTHVTRIANRLKLTDHKTDAVKIEHDLMPLVPQEGWALWSHLLIYHGRAICTARNPKCEACPILKYCPTGQESRARTSVADDVQCSMTSDSFFLRGVTAGAGDVIMVGQQAKTRLSLETGDVTQRVPVLVTFCVHFDFEHRAVELDLNGTQAKVEFDAWYRLTVQVQDRSLTRWQHDPNLPAPMGQQRVRRLVREIDSTPKYQLFLAAFDLIELLRIESDPDHVDDRFPMLSDFMTRPTRRGGLYFPPRNLLEDAGQDVLAKLVLNNKLCCVAISSDGTDELRTYYVPYATPIGFSTPVDKNVESLWSAIRNYHRQAKNQPHQ